MVQQPLGILGKTVLERRRAPGSVHGAFRRRTVVTRDVDEERVVRLPHLVQRIEQLPDLLVGVGHEAREHLHQTRCHRLVAVGVVGPRGHFVGAGGQGGPCGNHTQFQLAGVDPLAQHVPPVVELSLEPLDVLGPHVVRTVHGARGEVREERPVRVAGTLQLHPLDGLLRDVLAHVVVIATLVRHHRCGLVEHRRLELRRLRAEDAVEALEAESRRPAVERSRERLLMGRGHVPLSERAGGVPVLLQDLGDCRCFFRDDAVIPGETARTLGDVAHVHRVVVAAGQHGRPRRRAERRGVELVEPQTVLRHPVECRSGHRPTERAAGAEAHVIEKDQDDVRRILARQRDGRP